MIDPARTVKRIAHHRNQGDRANDGAPGIQGVTTPVAILGALTIGRLDVVSRRMVGGCAMNGVHDGHYPMSGATRGGS